MIQISALQWPETRWKTVTRRARARGLRQRDGSATPSVAAVGCAVRSANAARFHHTGAYHMGST
jgi:hypothetical protein